MFDIALPEFILAAVVALLVLGPERLPNALRTLGLWIGRLRRSYYNVKTEIEREIGMDEVRRQLHNEQVMADVKRVEREVQAMGGEVAESAESLLDHGESGPPAQAATGGSADGSGRSNNNAPGAPPTTAPAGGTAPSA